VKDAAIPDVPNMMWSPLMSRPLSKTSAGLLGSGIWVIGAVGTLILIFRAQDVATAIQIGLYSGCLVVGTWINATVKFSGGSERMDRHEAA